MNNWCRNVDGVWVHLPPAEVRVRKYYPGHDTHGEGWARNEREITDEEAKKKGLPKFYRVIGAPTFPGERATFNVFYDGCNVEDASAIVAHVMQISLTEAAEIVTCD